MDSILRPDKVWALEKSKRESGGSSDETLLPDNGSQINSNEIKFALYFCNLALKRKMNNGKI